MTDVEPVYLGDDFLRERDQWIRDVLADDHLPERYRMFAAFVGLSIHSKDHHAWPSQELVAGELGYDLRTAQRAAAALIARGWLIAQRVGRNSHNRYVLSFSGEVRAGIEIEREARGRARLEKRIRARQGQANASGVTHPANKPSDLEPSPLTPTTRQACRLGSDRPDVLIHEEEQTKEHIDDVAEESSILRDAAA